MGGGGVVVGGGDGGGVVGGGGAVVVVDGGGGAVVVVVGATAWSDATETGTTAAALVTVSVMISARARATSAESVVRTPAAAMPAAPTMTISMQVSRGSSVERICGVVRSTPPGLLAISCRIRRIFGVAAGKWDSPAVIGS